MTPRPRLKPYFRPLRRGADSVQLGVSAESGGVILSGLGPADIALLQALDGAPAEVGLDDMAAACGVPPDRAAELLALLREHDLLAVDGPDRVDLGRLRASQRDGLLHDAEVLALVRDLPGDPFARVVDRTHRRVLVSGSGRLPWSIAALLRDGGVGRVDVGGWALDAVEQELRTDPHRPRPDLVVLVAEGAVDPRQGEPWRRRGVPHLPVVSDGQRIVIGPLIGRDDDLPCLECLELSRTDRDSSWPHVRAQLPLGGGGEIRSESTMACVAAGVVAMVTHAVLAGDPVPPGVSLEVTVPWPRMDHRRWHRHPACPGHRTRHTSRPPAHAPDPARVTMTG